MLDKFLLDVFGESKIPPLVSAFMLGILIGIKIGHWHFRRVVSTKEERLKLLTDKYNDLKEGSDPIDNTSAEHQHPERHKKGLLKTHLLTCHCGHAMKKDREEEKRTEVRRKPNSTTPPFRVSKNVIFKCTNPECGDEQELLEKGVKKLMLKKSLSK